MSSDRSSSTSWSTLLTVFIGLPGEVTFERLLGSLRELISQELVLLLVPAHLFLHCLVAFCVSQVKVHHVIDNLVDLSLEVFFLVVFVLAQLIIFIR